MTLVGRPPQRANEHATGARAGRRHLKPAPLWAHLAGLAVVLVALVPLIGTDASFSADEGAAIAQARSLSRGDGWIVEHPMPEVDPTGRAYPLELSDQGEDGIAPFAKHPAYALVLAAADRLGGITAMVLLSVAGTVAAAGLAAAIAGRLDPALRKPAVWTVGVASPLLFDGYLLIAHSLGAAAVAATALAAVVALERRSLLAAAAVAPLTAAAILLRTEGALLAAALALVALGIAVRRANLRGTALVVAGGALASAFAVRLLERAWVTAIVGGPVNSSAPPRVDPLGLIDGRVNSFVLTWLRPSYDGPPLLDAALIVAMAGIALAVFVARRRPQDGSGITLAAVLAVAGVSGGLLLSPDNLVPGLLPAFPVGLAGLLLLDRATLRPPAATLLFGTFALFSVAVIATQYSSGGTAEWGGRYFAIGIPLLVPMALAALKATGTRIGPQAARTAAAALVVCSVGMAAMGVASIRSTHRFTAALVGQIERAGQEAGQAAGQATVQATGQDRPVMVATAGAIPRLAWSTFDRQRWLLVQPDELAEMMGRLRATGHSRVTFVTRDEATERRKLGAGVEVVGTTPTPGNGWAILTLKITP